MRHDGGFRGTRVLGGTREMTLPKPRRRVGGTRPDAAMPTLGALPSTVLSDPTPLIDREGELEAIRAHLLGESVRLMTLTGLGASGKHAWPSRRRVTSSPLAKSPVIEQQTATCEALKEWRP
jgi:hypothetical protein